MMRYSSCCWVYTFFLVFALFSPFAASTALAQWVETPLEYSPTLRVAAANALQSLRSPSAAGDTLTLPFLDDFSYTPDAGVYPAASLWSNSKSVYVNRTMSLAPPTLGMATFDGLDAKGIPYSTLAGASGSCDTLTSKPIDVSNQTDTVFLSFFFQPQGLGDSPETNDKFVVEFQKPDGSWAIQLTIQGYMQGTDTSFVFYRLTLDPLSYAYNGFRFRMRNVSSQQGARDIWNIDYVKLAAKRSSHTTSVKDIAFYQSPLSALRTYAAMPLTHFKANTAEMNRNIAFAVSNRDNQDRTPKLKLNIIEQRSGQTIHSDTTLVLTSTFGGNTQQKRAVNNVPNYDLTSIMAANDSAFIITNYTIDDAQPQDALANQINCIAINDGASRRTELKNYFAYDDGTAESNIAAQNVGTLAAVKFHANIADTLRGVQMQFFRAGNDITNKRFNFWVYLGGLPGTKSYEIDFQKPVYSDSLNGWTSFSLEDQSIGLPANTDFYIAWQAASTGDPIPIGFDKNTPQASQYIYQNLGGGWSPLPSYLKGAVMMRPLVGSKIQFVATNNLPNLATAFKVFPNPTNGTFSLQRNDENTLNATSYSVANTLGSIVASGNVTNTTTNIDISAMPSGVYVLSVISNQASVANYRIVLIK